MCGTVIKYFSKGLMDKLECANHAKQAAAIIVMWRISTDVDKTEYKSG